MAAMALGAGNATPQAPNPQPNEPSVSLGMGSAPQIAPRGMALGGGGQQQQQPQQQQQQIPAPTHAQTVAAMRHFWAIRDVIAEVMQDPALGKSSVKKRIVDGVAELVANRILTPGDAVKELMEVPERPYDQKQWLIDADRMARQAQIAVLDHYAYGHQGVAAHLIDRESDPEDHLDHMAGLMEQFRGRPNA